MGHTTSSEIEWNPIIKHGFNAFQDLVGSRASANAHRSVCQVAVGMSNVVECKVFSLFGGNCRVVTGQMFAKFRSSPPGKPWSNAGVSYTMRFFAVIAQAIAAVAGQFQAAES
jgi:hypothetical protein